MSETTTERGAGRDSETTRVGDQERIIEAAGRVIGQPIERDGTTLVPVLTVRGGSGGGRGSDREGNEGGGSGWGVTARPVGAYVIRDGRVEWQPAVDVLRLVVGFQVLAIVGLLVLRSLRRRRR